MRPFIDIRDSVLEISMMLSPVWADSSSMFNDSRDRTCNIFSSWELRLLVVVLDFGEDTPRISSGEVTILARLCLIKLLVPFETDEFIGPGMA